MSAWIEHPDLPGQRVEVADQSVPHYRAAGWQVTDAPPKPEKLPADDAKTSPIPAENQSEESQSTPADEAESKTEPESPKPRRRTTKED